jgi:hypothetical protein
MQGAFPAGADWASALQPGNDERVDRIARSDIVEQELYRIARARPGVPAPPPLAARLQYVGGPFPPTAHFQVAGETYYILQNGMQNQRARPGVFGHYLQTMVVYRLANGTELARPFINQQAFPNGVREPVPPDGPGLVAGDLRTPPNARFCRLLRDYTTPTYALYNEIGLVALREALEQAEALDMAFARRMEGLGNVAPDVCWGCLDPDYDPSDRPAVRDLFLAKYLGRFYEGQDPEDGPPSEDVADEAMHKHKAFCQAWSKKHYRSLTPAVTAPAEALASEFYKYMEETFPANTRPTRAELARILMRHPETATDFATCLHFYSTGLEQARGGRNASYKQMSAVTSARATSYKRMGDLLGAKMPALSAYFQTLEASMHNRAFDVLIVDWYAILGQMPHVHRFFDGLSMLPGFKRARRPPDAGDHVPPWKFGK